MQLELSNEYQHDMVYMVFKDLCILVLWTKVASALEGLVYPFLKGHTYEIFDLEMVIGNAQALPLQIYYEVLLFYSVIIKNIIGPDDSLEKRR